MPAFDDIRRDIRDGLRALTRRPGFTVVAVLSLALGIGANTAIFSLVNAVLLREIPLRQPEELVNLYMHSPSFQYGTLSYPDYEDVRDGTTEVFSQIGATQFAPVQIDGDSGGVNLVFAEAVTGSYFPTIGIDAFLGRTILPEDDVSPGAHPVVMLSHGYWQRAFGERLDAIGQTLRVGGRAYEVIGVAPPDFPGSMRGISPAFYAPYMMIEELMGAETIERRGNHSMFPTARLKPGVTLPQAETALAAVAADLTANATDGWERTSEFAILPITDVLLFPPMDPFVRGAAWLMMVVVGLLLLLACTNLASFLLARALDRRRDVAVRLALGASRGSLVRRLLTETTLLSLVAGSVGIGLAVALLQILQNADLPLPVPIELDLSLDWNVLAFTLGISVVAGGLLGLVPALQSTRPDVASTLKSETGRWRAAGPAPLAQRAGRHATDGVTRAAGRRGALSTQLSGGAGRRPRFRAGADCPHDVHGADQPLHGGRGPSLHRTPARAFPTASRRERRRHHRPSASEHPQQPVDRDQCRWRRPAAGPRILQR